MYLRKIIAQCSNQTRISGYLHHQKDMDLSQKFWICMLKAIILNPANKISMKEMHKISIIKKRVILLKLKDKTNKNS